LQSSSLSLLLIAFAPAFNAPWLPQALSYYVLRDSSEIRPPIRTLVKEAGLILSNFAAPPPSPPGYSFVLLVCFWSRAIGLPLSSPLCLFCSWL
jgi:hypothetical protein